MSRDGRISSQSTENKYDHIFKLLMVGNSCVGKTSFISMYTNGEFHESFQPTVGIDYWAKHLPSFKGQHNIFLQVWDTAGQERYQSVSNAYYRGANAFIVMFDLTNQESYIACKQWISHIRENAPEDVILVLVGNKSDLEKEQKVLPENIDGMASSMDIKYFPCSVKHNINVTEVVEYLVEVLIEQSKSKKGIHEETPLLLNSSRSNSSTSTKPVKCSC